MRISDWSSDVCSSDLRVAELRRPGFVVLLVRGGIAGGPPVDHRLQIGVVVQRLLQRVELQEVAVAVDLALAGLDRKSVVSGKSVSVRVDLGGRRIINKKNSNNTIRNHSKHNKL